MDIHNWWPVATPLENSVSRAVEWKSVAYFAVWGVDLILSRLGRKFLATILSVGTFISFESTTAYVVRISHVRTHKILAALRERIKEVDEGGQGVAAMIDILDPNHILELNALAARQFCRPLFRQADSISGHPQLRADLKGILKKGTLSTKEELRPHFERFKQLIVGTNKLKGDRLAIRNRNLWLVWGVLTECWRMSCFLERRGPRPFPSGILLPQVA